MKILGIESTAHTFGIGILDTTKKKFLFNKKIVYKNINGLNIRELNNFHTENFTKILSSAKKKLDFKKLDLISFSQGPGIGNSLKIGNLVAKTLALQYNKKIIGVNHIISHLEIGKYITNFKDPIFLNITGVNSQIIISEKNNYKVIGETIDIGLGNLFDSIGKLFNFEFPCGQKIEERAKKGKKFYEIPFSIKGMNVSFSGIFTYVKTLYQKNKNDKNFINDICFSLQETCFSMLIEICERGIFYSKKKELIIVGGVASNKKFFSMTKKMCQKNKIKIKKLPLEFCMDNGAMICVSGFVNYKKAKNNIKDLEPKPYLRIN